MTTTIPSGYTKMNRCKAGGKEYYLLQNNSDTTKWGVYVPEGGSGGTGCGSCQKGADSDSSTTGNIDRCTKSDSATTDGGGGCNNTYAQCMDCLCGSQVHCGCVWDTSSPSICPDGSTCFSSDGHDNLCHWEVYEGSESAAKDVFKQVGCDGDTGGNEY